jgi:hypothetical protein
MSAKTKAILGTAAAAVFLNFTAVGQAFAVWCAADASMIYGNIVGKFAPFLQTLIAQTGLSTESAIIQAGAATRAEILKSATVGKTVEEGLESYRQQEELRNRSQDIKASMQQPALTCQAMATSTSLSSAGQISQAKVFSSQAKVMTAVASNTNTVKALESSYASTNSKFCSADEAERGVCRLSTNSKYANLAGGDRDAMFLFQAKDGSSSYEGVDNGAQSEAVDSYIARVVAAMPPEQLRDQGEEFYRKNPQARRFAELQRRYNAMASMGAYSLSQIKEAHRTLPGLGRDTMLATVSVPGFTPNKNDMSMAEVVERYVATKFSADAVRDLAKATQPNLILRNMAQDRSFQLWMSFQALQQGSRMEALNATQLALLAESTLRPQVDAQRYYATQAQAQAAK